jgi:uncharacterized membrane protein YraQ (UPF0718 family)
MKNPPKILSATYLRRLVPFLVFCTAVALSFSARFLPGINTAKAFRGFFIEMVVFLPLMFILIGLFDVWFPRSKIERHIGKDSGAKGILWVVLLATLQAGPLYGSFPVAYMLWKKGSSPFNIFVYLGAFSAMKIPMLTFEIGFLGWRFSLLRTALSIPVFIAVAWIIDRGLKGKTFVINDGGTPPNPKSSISDGNGADEQKPIEKGIL